MPYTARKINPDDSQNLGDYSIIRTYTRGGYENTQLYHYDSKTGRLINRSAYHLPIITKGSRIYNSCMKAVGRAMAEEV